MKKPTKIMTVSSGIELYNTITRLAKEGRRSRNSQLKLMLEEWITSKAQGGPVR